MLESLRIRGLGLIEQADLDLANGLVIVTGETGAGKTLMLDAVRVIAGQKPNTVNQQSDTTVDSVLSFRHDSIRELLSEVGIESEEGSYLISRIFPQENRAKTSMSGRPVPASVLADAAATWLAIHGQHDSYRLMKSATHRDLLDRYGGAELEQILATHAHAYAQWSKLQAELKRLRKEREQMLSQAESIKADVALVDALNLRAGEDLEIAEKIDRISRIEQVRQAIDIASSALSNDEYSVASALSASRKALEQGLPGDSQAAELGRRLADLAAETNEISAEIARIGSDVDDDSSDLDALMLRQRQIKSLILRHGPTLDDVLKWVTDARRMLALIDPDGAAIGQMEREVEAALAAARETAAVLTDARMTVAKSLADEVSIEVRGLAMPYSQFVVEVAPAELSEFGSDRVEFMFTANPGTPPAPLNQAASGGELSRLMLALEVVLADVQSPSVMVFDEVDTGVAGAAAIAVGQRLAKLANNRQVLVVTHLPQIAAFADQHFFVSKTSDGSTTSTDIAELAGADRLTEIARMLAGIETSESARAHSEELLHLATAFKESLSA